MAILVGAALAVAWVVVLRRGSRRTSDPVASVGQQQRAFEAMAAASSTARRRRGAPEATPRPPGGVDTGRGGARWAAIAGLAVVTALSLGAGAMLLPDRVGIEGDDAGSRRGSTGSSATPAREDASTPTPSAPAGSSGSTPTTTPLPDLVPVPVPGEPGTRRIEVGRAGFVVTVAADRPCWVQVRNAAGDDVSFEATLAAAASESFPADTGLWIRLGAPGAVRLLVDGRPLTSPPDGDSPVDLVFATTAEVPG